MTAVIGVDPGLKGALAFYDGTSLHTVSMPVAKAATRGNEVMWAVLKSEFDLPYELMKPEHVFIERVHSKPKEGVASAFKFGYVSGGLRGFVTAYELPVTMVTPNQWKRALRVGNAKQASLARACELFPNHTDQFYGPKGGLRDGPAEAALIAWYGYRELFRE